MNYRVDRLNGEMQRSIADIIRNRLKDPRVTEMVSVLKVDVAKDLKTAKVYLSIYGNPENCTATFEALKNSTGFIKKELSHDFKDIRCVPTLTLFLDDSMEYSHKINTVLAEIKKNEEDGKR